MCIFKSKRECGVALALSAAAFLLCWAVALTVYFPLPKIHDEFSTLLAVEILAQGKLSAPPPAFREHFETVHVISAPRQMSKYLPGLALILAASKIITGEVFWGQWLLFALMIGSIFWVLSALLPLSWAALGAICAALQLGFVLEQHFFATIGFGYWAHSYMNGALPAVGGALMLGAFLRLREQGRISLGLGSSFMAGAIILLYTRPFEGAAWLLAISICFYSDVARLIRISFRTSTFAWLALQGLTAVGWLLYYNFQITGDPLKLPYVAYEEQYSGSPLFAWSNYSIPSQASTGFLQHYRQWEHALAGAVRAHGYIVEFIFVRLPDIFSFFLGQHLFALLLLLPLLSAAAPLRRLFLVLLLFLACLVPSTFYLPHYVAPATALFYLLMAAGLQVLRQRLRPSFILPLVPTAAVLFYLVGHAALVWYRSAQFDYNSRWNVKRRQIEECLKKTTDRYLILVHYEPWHNAHFDWVHNAPDPLGQQVIWARSLGPDKDQQLIKALQEIEVLRLFPDGKSTYLEGASSVISRTAQCAKLHLTTPDEMSLPQ